MFSFSFIFLMVLKPTKNVSYPWVGPRNPLPAPAPAPPAPSPPQLTFFYILFVTVPSKLLMVLKPTKNVSYPWVGPRNPLPAPAPPTPSPPQLTIFYIVSQFLVNFWGGIVEMRAGVLEDPTIGKAQGCGGPKSLTSKI